MNSQVQTFQILTNDVQMLILSLSYLITTATNFAYSIIHNLSDASRQINVFKLKFVTNDPKIVGLALENWSVKK